MQSSDARTSVNGNRFNLGIGGALTPQPTSPSAHGSERPSGQVTATNLKKLLEHQRYLCAITGIELTPQTVALDHIVPLSSGGADSMENVQLVHAVVNAMKGTLGMGEFIEWCKLVARKSI